MAQLAIIQMYVTLIQINNVQTDSVNGVLDIWLVVLVQTNVQAIIVTKAPVKQKKLETILQHLAV